MVTLLQRLTEAAEATLAVIGDVLREFDLTTSAAGLLWALNPRAKPPTMRSLATGQLLCQFGDPPGPLFIILSGKLIVYRPNPKRPYENIELAQLGPGAVVGEVAPILGQLRSASVRALEASTLLAVPVDQLSVLAKQQSPVIRVIVIRVPVIRAPHVRAAAPPHPAARAPPPPARHSRRSAPLPPTSCRDRRRSFAAKRPNISRPRDATSSGDSRKFLRRTKRHSPRAACRNRTAPDAS